MVQKLETKNCKSQLVNNFLVETRDHSKQSLVRVSEVLLQVLGHAEALDLLISKDRSHGLVRGEPLLVLGVLEFLLLQVGPEPLHALNERYVICGRNTSGQWSYLRSRDLLPLLGPNNLGQLCRDIELHLHNH